MKRILIQNGTVYDGLGGQPYQADLLVQDGRIAEQGSHAQLLAENGAYARLYHTQNLGENHG